MNPVHRAIERVGEYFADRTTRPAYVARQLLQTQRADDDRLRPALVRARRARQRSDGSVAGDLVATAFLVWELRDLDQPGDSPAVQRAVKWMMARQDKDGAYAPPQKRRAPVDP